MDFAGIQVVEDRVSMGDVELEMSVQVLDGCYVAWIGGGGGGGGGKRLGSLVAGFQGSTGSGGDGCVAGLVGQDSAGGDVAEGMARKAMAALGCPVFVAYAPPGGMPDPLVDAFAEKSLLGLLQRVAAAESTDANADADAVPLDS